jgi:LAO/AO transport system kinase
LAEAGELALRVRAGEDAAIAAAISLVESSGREQQGEARELLARLAQRTPAQHHVVGITGPPGAGKSSLCAALLRYWLDAGSGVGVLAVDPSSRRSGGALLGDRARLRFAPGQRAFVRSMAAREHLGGLSAAAQPAIAILRAAFEWTLVETVGVGQSEIEIEAAADSVVLVLQPGSGDTLQFMKAGILEIPDVFAVHKWDVGAPAQRTRADLESLLPLVAPRGGAWQPPVLGTSAHSGEGVAELARTLARHREQLAASGELERRRRAGRCAWAMLQFQTAHGTRGLERLGGREAALALCASAPGTLLDALAALEDAARKGRS